jgi:hypothetical protein
MDHQGAIRYAAKANDHAENTKHRPDTIVGFDVFQNLKETSATPEGGSNNTDNCGFE